MTVAEVMYDMYPEDYVQIENRDEEIMIKGKVIDLAGNQYSDAQIRFIRPALYQITPWKGQPIWRPVLRVCIDCYA